MSKRMIISAALGIFLLFSLAVALFRSPDREQALADANMATPPATETADVRLAASAPAETPAPAATVTPTAAPKRPHVIAYYFHVTQRCVTCSTIEKYSFEALNTYFSPQIEEEILELRSVDVQQPENKHYIRDFELQFQTLVLARYEDDRLEDWKNLAQVWQLVQEKEEFFLYVKSETDAILQEAQ